MHIGLIGGIGPAATVDYYQRLVGRVRDAGARLEVTIAHADIGTLIANARGDAPEAQARVYAHHIDQLRAAGAACATITSLGGHFCFAETKAVSSLPLVSGITPIRDHLAANGLRRVGLLGTDVVMRSRLYGQLDDVETVVPDGDLTELGMAYQRIAIAGVCSDEERATLFEAGRGMVANQGAEAVILAGTDLGLAFDNHDPGYPVIDALNLHVALLADLALDRIPLPA